MLRAARPRIAALARAGLVVASLAVTACGEPGREWFPLAAGHRWTYDVKTEYANDAQATHETLVMSTLGHESLDGIGEGWHRRSDSGVDYWLASDDSGIYRVASKNDLQAEPAKDETRRYVLKAPYSVGTAWQASTTAYLLRRRSEFPPEIRHSHPSIPMGYAIDAVGQKVSTRAGTFDGCLRVKGEARLRLFTDPVQGWHDMPLTTTEWYCPGVGLVMLKRDEPANTAFLYGGALTMELVEWR